MSLRLEDNDYSATLDRRELYIGSGTDFQGTIDSLNNWFTKKIFRLFNAAIDIKIGGEQFVVKKSSYLNFLTTQGINDASKGNLFLYADLDQIRNVKPLFSGRLLREVLTAKTVDLLAQSMIKELIAGHEEKAIHWLKKGAGVDRYFWSMKNSTTWVSFKENYEKDLPYESLEKVTLNKLTPLLYSAEKGQKLFRDLLLSSFKPNLTLVGEALVLTRTLLHKSRTLMPHYTNMGQPDQTVFYYYHNLVTGFDEVLERGRVALNNGADAVEKVVTSILPDKKDWRKVFMG